MKKTICAAVLGFGLSQFALAQSVEDLYFDGANPKLTPMERAAIKLAEDFNKSGAATIKPWTGPDGSIVFLYGGQRVSIVCAVLQVCDIALQPGEKVTGIHSGDTVRWLIEPAIEGSGFNQIQHLIIKPMGVGLETSLAVTTDRRTYHFELRSHRTKYMPYVSFAYPEVAQAKWAAIQTKNQQGVQRNTIPTTGEYLGDLDFNYQLTGDASWKPVRVYNNGVKTIIQMPKSVKQFEAPTLLVIRKDGSFFKDEETIMVNYRIQNNKYIVDNVFDKAILIAGVGSDQSRITITKGE